jgi:MoxR-like ATPase
MDRFFMRLEMGYPAHADELEILAAGFRHYDHIRSEPVVKLASVQEWQALVGEVFVETSVLEYLLRLVVATRSESTFQCGVSPRGALALKAAAQARALYHGRAYVIPADVAAMLLPVCGHRLKSTVRGSDPLEERRRVEGVLAHITGTVAAPL